jgi:hypothetical protein
VDRVQDELDAAAALRECRSELAARGTTVLGEAVGAAEADIRDWLHYPDGEIYDPATHVQYFFHRHPGASSPKQIDRREAGHFHVFLGGDAIPAWATPLVLPEMAVANAPRPGQSAPLRRGARDEICHLVGIAIDTSGEPIRLFTTNRWVTGETWYPAADVIGMLERVRLSAAAPLPVLSRWVEAVVRLFRPEIAVLLRNRDNAIADWRWHWPRVDAFEDIRLETTSSLPVGLKARLAAVENRAGSSIPAGILQTPAHLPPMSEGWGM